MSEVLWRKPWASPNEEKHLPKLQTVWRMVVAVAPDILIFTELVFQDHPYHRRYVTLRVAQGSADAVLTQAFTE